MNTSKTANTPSVAVPSIAVRHGSRSPMPVALLLLAVSLQGAATAQRAPGQGERPAVPVEVEVVQERQVTPTTRVLGGLEPKRRSVVAASIEGYVIDYPIDEGQRVESGAVLARLRSRVLKLQLAEAQAALAAIRERHRNAERDLERARELIKIGAVTQKDLDERATLERTLALAIPQSEARVAILEADIDKKTVTSPYAGQIVEEHTEVGEWLPRGGPVATLVDISSVYVRVAVREQIVRFVEPGRSVSISVPAASDEPYTGVVVSVSDQGDPESRTFPVRVEVKNDGRLRAGLSASVEFPAGRAMSALTVSKDAVLLQGTRSYVWLYGEGGRPERRDIITGASSGSRFAVLEGLRPGDRVIVRGNERINPGDRLRIVRPEARAP